MSRGVSELVGAMPFDVQVMIWGAAWWGELADLNAMLAESPDHIQRRMWDSTKADLDTQVLLCPDGVSRPPDSWALPHAWEWKLRRPRSADSHGDSES